MDELILVTINTVITMNTPDRRCADPRHMHQGWTKLMAASASAAVFAETTKVVAGAEEHTT